MKQAKRRRIVIHGTIIHPDGTVERNRRAYTRCIRVHGQWLLPPHWRGK
jgi:hypothetical protein